MFPPYTTRPLIGINSTPMIIRIKDCSYKRNIARDRVNRVCQRMGHEGGRDCWGLLAAGRVCLAERCTQCHCRGMMTTAG